MFFSVYYRKKTVYNRFFGISRVAREPFTSLFDVQWNNRLEKRGKIETAKISRFFSGSFNFQKNCHHYLALYIYHIIYFFYTLTSEARANTELSRVFIIMCSFGLMLIKRRWVLWTESRIANFLSSFFLLYSFRPLFLYSASSSRAVPPASDS